jgi:hypothetical protein
MASLSNFIKPLETITTRELLERLLYKTIKNKRVRDIIKISILGLLRIIIRTIRRSIDTLDTKRT